MKLTVRVKLFGSSMILLGFGVIIGIVSIISLGSVNDASQELYNVRVVAVAALGDEKQNLVENQQFVLRGIVYIGDAATQATIDTDLAANQAQVKKSWTEYTSTPLDSVENGFVTDYAANYPRYETALQAVRTAAKAGDKTAAMTANTDLKAVYAKILADVDGAFQHNVEMADVAAKAVQSTHDSSLMIILVLLAAATIIGLALSYFIASQITNGVKAVQSTLESLTTKCATWLQEGLSRLRDNDLTYEVTPVTPSIEKWGSDEIGQTAVLTNQLRDKIVATIEAYNGARDGLRDTITSVRDAAEAVAQTSGQLNAAATQSGAAVQQVATTIQQVAAGAADQARASSETSGAVQQLSSVISQVGAGAAQTTTKVEQASATIEQLTAAIRQTSEASTEVGEVTASAAGAATNGAAAVKDTVAGMSRIKSAVSDAAVKVTELGAKGEQIGAIVETIDDIAEQTNLLALNAAIEAARAGEMGKGFAVVADEVRKLAERSGRATKEIADLIRQVQAGTSEAVKAMQVGATEVEAGSQLAAKSGAALDEIAAAVNATRAAVGRITGAVDRMNAASAGVVKAIDEIAGIAQGNNTAAGTMASSAASVSRSVESIAAVSEENSAAAEEVSAATEEMSAQAEEVVASAQSLAQMADQLDELVARFRLADEGHQAQAGNVIQRRRTVDWQGGTKSGTKGGSKSSSRVA